MKRTLMVFAAASCLFVAYAASQNYWGLPLLKWAIIAGLSIVFALLVFKGDERRER